MDIAIIVFVISIGSAEFELPIVYTVSSGFPHPISIFTKSFKLPKKYQNFEFIMCIPKSFIHLNFNFFLNLEVF